MADRPPPLALFTYRELMREAQREAGLRRFVYPKRVEGGKLTQSAATRQIAMMEAMAAHFGALAQEEERATSLPLGDR